MTVTIADVPGIIKNSFEKKGLGIEFLRHCGRVKMFAFVLDMSEIAKNSPLEQLEILRSEIGKYDSTMLEKPYMIIANKNDTLYSNEKIELLRNTLENVDILDVSGRNAVNLDKLVVHLRENVVDVAENRDASVESDDL